MRQGGMRDLWEIDGIYSTFYWHIMRLWYNLMISWYHEMVFHQSLGMNWFTRWNRGFHWGNMVIWWGLGISFFAEGSRQIIPVTSLGCRHTDLDKLWQLVFSEGLLVGENQWKAHRILDVGKAGGYLGTPLELGWCLLWPAHGDSDLVATAAPRKPRGFVKASTPRWWESSRPEDSKANVVI